MDKPNKIQNTFYIVGIIVMITFLIALFVVIYVVLLLPDLLSSGLSDFDIPDFGEAFCSINKKLG